MSNSPCSICLVEKIADPANLDGCSHTYCFKCIINWAERSNTCPACKSKFHKITRKKNGKVTEVEEREQGTNYTIEDAENDYGESASEESEYGAAHPFIDEEAESGEETSEDEVEAQKECNTWAGYLNCEDERFEKRSSEEEIEALSDEDYAHMGDSDYDYDDFVVADDDVSMLTDASSDSSERGRVKRRRLKRARSASSSSSSEIHISIEEEDSIDEDQPRRKRRRIDDDVPDPHPVPLVKIEAINDISPLRELHGTNEPSDIVMTDNNGTADTKEIAGESKPADIKPVDTKPTVAIETTADETTEVRTKKRKHAKRNSNQLTRSDIVPSSQRPSVSVKNERTVEIKVEANTHPLEEGRKESKSVPAPVSNNIVATGETKKKKKKKKKSRPNAEISLSQGTNGTGSQLSPLPPPTMFQSNGASSGNTVQALLPKKKNKKKKKKSRHIAEVSLSQGTNGTNSQASPLPTPTMLQSTGAGSNIVKATVSKKKKKKKNKKNRPNVAIYISLSPGTNGTSTQASPLPTPITLQSRVDGSGNAVQTTVSKEKKKRNRKKKNGLASTNTIVAYGASNPRVPLKVVPNKSALQSASPIDMKVKKELKVEHKSAEKLQHTNGKTNIKIERPHTMVHYQKSETNDEKPKGTKQKNSKKNKPSTNGAVNGGTSDGVRLSFDEKRSAEERYQRLKNLISQM